jgi:AraC-like DNA-binding protein
MQGVAPTIEDMRLSRHPLPTGATLSDMQRLPSYKSAPPAPPRERHSSSLLDSSSPTPRALSPQSTVDVDAVSLPAFGLEDDYGPLLSAWHSHNKHQLLYAASGTLQLEVEGSQWLLPPQRAAWICARLRHRVRALSRVALRTVYLSPRQQGAMPSACVVFAASPLAREMILYAMRWGPSRRADDTTARAFFEALSALACEWAESALPFRLPTPRSPELGRAMQYAIEELSGAPTVEEAAKRAGLSTRTLGRRFTEEAQTSWRQFLHHARMMRAMELLAAPGARVTDTALAVGFESPGSFTRAFEEFTGEKPKDYRKRRTG